MAERATSVKHTQGSRTLDDETEDLLTTEEAARYLRLSPRTLERYRMTGEGPEYLKVGGRVFYRKAALDEWLELARRRSTSDPGPPDLSRDHLRRRRPGRDGSARSAR